MSHISQKQLDTTTTGTAGILMYKEVADNFVVITKLKVFDNTTRKPPGDPLHSAGLLAQVPNNPRDRLKENWVMVNLGYQETALGSESKSTENSVSKLSKKHLTASEGLVMLCRVGDWLFTYRWTQDDAGWAKLTQFKHPDLPQRLQVRLVVNSDKKDATIRAEFDDIRFHAPQTKLDGLPFLKP